jgi:hypothetical protein
MEVMGQEIMGCGMHCQWKKTKKLNNESINEKGYT